MQNLLGRNLYFTCCLFALLGGISTYLYFFNREVLTNTSVENAQEDAVGDSTKIVVDISGAVDRPGVFTLDSGSRLADLLNFAGGTTSEVSQKWLSRNLNLASILKDQQKIYIPFEWEVIPSSPEYELKELALGAVSPLGNTSVASNTANSGESTNSSGDTSEVADSTSDGTTTLINLNSATKEELESLPKVGEVTAGKIIDFRPYVDFDDLQEKTGIYDSVVEAIKDLVTF
jgi:competence protein ComEA